MVKLVISSITLFLIAMIFIYTAFYRDWGNAEFGWLLVPTWLGNIIWFLSFSIITAICSAIDEKNQNKYKECTKSSLSFHFIVLILWSLSIILTTIQNI